MNIPNVDRWKGVIGFYRFHIVSGETLSNETIIEIKEDIKLYAIWNFEIIRFKYIGNTGTLANWKPLYINKIKFTGGVTPHSGTAFKLGINS